MDLPVLYSFRRCPYAMRARLALAVSGQTVELREVVLRDKPLQMIEASPKATVPVLVEPDGRILEQSFDIMLWSLERSDPEGWLVPWKREHEEVRSLIEESDGPFKHHLDRYKYANRYEGADPKAHREQGAAFLAKLDKQLEKTGWLFGQSRTLADMAILPFVRQFAFTDKAWFDQTPLPAVHKWLESFLASDLFTAVMRKYKPWTEGAERIQFPG